MLASPTTWSIRMGGRQMLGSTTLARDARGERRPPLLQLPLQLPLQLQLPVLTAPTIRATRKTGLPALMKLRGDAPPAQPHCQQLPPCSQPHCQQLQPHLLQPHPLQGGWEVLTTRPLSCHRGQVVSGQVLE